MSQATRRPVPGATKTSRDRMFVRRSGLVLPTALMQPLVCDLQR